MIYRCIYCLERVEVRDTREDQYPWFHVTNGRYTECREAVLGFDRTTWRRLAADEVYEALE